MMTDEKCKFVGQEKKVAKEISEEEEKHKKHKTFL
jgi:hypothetical protein